MPDSPQPVQARLLVADDITVKGLQSVADYTPMSPELAVAQLLQLQSRLTRAVQSELTAEETLSEARKEHVAASHAYHDAVVAARAQVIAQYGPDSPVLTLIGLTRKSERKRPAKRTKAVEEVV